MVVPVAVAEPRVETWRLRYDPSAALGMPAHITALYPFLSQERLTASAIARLSKLCESLPALRVEFRRTRRFPDVLYLDPEPADGLRRLTTTIFEEWPQAPPFRGEFDDVIPHLTIVNGEDDEILDMVEQEISADLPFEAQLARAWLLVFDGARWQWRARFGFRSAAR